MQAAKYIIVVPLAVLVCLQIYRGEVWFSSRRASMRPPDLFAIDRDESPVFYWLTIVVESAVTVWMAYKL